MKRGVKELRKFAWADSTRKTRDSQWRKYLCYCERVAVTPLPLDMDIVSTFLLHMALQGLKYSTINNQVSALILFAKLNDSWCDLRSDFNLQLTLKALRRIIGDSSESKDELFPIELLKIFDQVNLKMDNELCIWTGILFLYRSLLRKGHVFSGEFNENLLKRSEVQFTDYGLLVTVSRSKTIQCSERTVQIPVCRVIGPFCIVSLLERFVSHFPVPSDSPLLSRIVDDKLVLVSYSTALSSLKRWGMTAGIQKDLGMHSLRRGAATVMSMAGFNLEDIKDRGDWRSIAVLRYLAYPLRRKIAIDQKISELLNSSNY